MMETVSDRMIADLPLHSYHSKLGAKFGHFGSWNVPLYYSSIMEEHRQVRSRAGLFDISHMGEFWIEGEEAERALDQLLPRNIPKLEPSQAVYSPLLNHEGGFVDDVIVYRVNQQRFLIIVNATNIEKDARWIGGHLRGRVSFQDESASTGLLALQGPLSTEILGRCFKPERLPQKNFRFTEVEGYLIARTGYTGELGYEILSPLTHLPQLWETIVSAAKEDELKAIGFGARDTLRFEAGMLLYGQDMDETVNPFEAGVDWAVDMNKGDFIGKEALVQSRQKGLDKKLVGLEIDGRAIARHGCPILSEAERVGEVSSGVFSPTFSKSLAMGYVSTQLPRLGCPLKVRVREREVTAKVVSLPFYTRKK